MSAWKKFFAYGVVMMLSHLVASGCGGVKTDYSGLELQNVSGVVTLDGLPLADAVIKFEATDGTFSLGQTDASGNYRLMLNSEKSGVMPGPKVVRVTTVGGVGEETAEDGGAEGGAAATAGAQERVPPCYNRQSKLRANVERSATMNFDLKSDCSVTSPTN